MTATALERLRSCSWRLFCCVQLWLGSAFLALRVSGFALIGGRADGRGSLCASMPGNGRRVAECYGFEDEEGAAVATVVKR